MPRKRDGFVPLGDVVAGVELPDGRTLTPAAPGARHHFTRLDQIDQLVDASEADADLGFMARLLARCLRHSLLIRQPICVRAATRTMTARLG